MGLVAVEMELDGRRSKPRVKTIIIPTITTTIITTMVTTLILIIMMIGGGAAAAIVFGVEAWVDLELFLLLSYF